jgi:peptide-methionine (S)-S-oxide reductase
MSLERATFAAGCFWHVEDAFRQVKGVTGTRVGYTGGATADPTYEQVCTDRTGHAEAVEVTFDPAVVSYEELLDVFLANHDPTQINRQGPDIGTQYRSAVFVHGPAQRKAAEASIQRLEQTGRLARPVATQVAEAGPFFHAEEYHQQYYEKRGISSCRF